MSVVCRTESGRICGRIRDGCVEFLGIPYAGPLIGRARFLPPEPASTWDGVREATTFSSAVPQAPAVNAGPLAVEPVWRPGDDPECLTLNIYSPDVGAALPVMVWLHGGAFLGGTAGTPDFDGSVLAQGGVVVVTVNYRVGYEGFGWVRDSPANRGILDQIAALRWITDNVAAFGGDPARITLFGQSAGASSIATLIAGNNAADMFGRAILQSAGNVFVPDDEARIVSTMITDSLGITPTVDDLTGVGAEAIHAVQMGPVLTMAAEPSAWTHPHSPFTCIIDGGLLDDVPWKSLRPTAPLDVVCGYTVDEARMFTAGMDLSGADLAQSATGVGLEAEAAQAYRSAYPDADVGTLVTLMLSDALFRQPALRLTSAYAAAGHRSYLYEFDWRTTAMGGTLGACHGLDVPFVFGLPDSPIGRALLGDPAAGSFEGLSEPMRTAWTSFAATGHPGWPQFDAETRAARRWADAPDVTSDPLADSRAIWAQFGR